MKCNCRVLIWALHLSVFLVPASSLSSQPTQHPVQTEDHDKSVDAAHLQNPVLWHNPGAISQLDLFYGQGGKDGQPVPPFKFQVEDFHGTNPKFNVRDAHGDTWRVKLGDETRPEVAASRLLWAVGYFVNVDYVLASADVENLQITRGATLASEGHIVDARFERKPDEEKKIGIWRWKDNPFTDTKELNGLRVMMALMNNWDLKDENNAVLADKNSGNDLFLTSDIGSAFGTNGLSWSKGRSKGDVETFEKSRFIMRKTDRTVDFATPAAPSLVEAPNVKQYEKRRDLEWIGRNIPIADARWIGSLLLKLTHEQLVDAFRAGQFTPDEIDRYVRVLESRIHELAAL